MSSTSKQIWEAQKLAEQIEKGEHPVVPQSSATSGASAEQLTTQKQDIDIPDDATAEGMRAESSRVVDDVKVTEPVTDREIGKVVGKGQEHKLSEFFGDPTTAGEDKTAVDTMDLTPAEKQTQLTDNQVDAEDKFSKTKAGHAVDDDELPSAKQTKVSEEQKKAVKAQRYGEEYSGDASADAGADAGVDAGAEVSGETGGDTGAGETTTETTVVTDGGDSGNADASAGGSDVYLSKKSKTVEKKQEDKKEYKKDDKKA